MVVPKEKLSLMWKILRFTSASFILLNASTAAKEPRRCYWCGPLAEQVHRSTRAPICVPSANYITTCEPGLNHCAIVATSPPYVESRYCVKMYQDECYPLYCNSSKTWKMTCPCRGDLCNGQNSKRENEAFVFLTKLVSETHGKRIKRTIVPLVSFIQSKNNKMSVTDLANDKINKYSHYDFNIAINCSDLNCKTENINFTDTRSTIDQMNLGTEELKKDTVASLNSIREDHDPPFYTYTGTSKHTTPINEVDSTEVTSTAGSRYKVSTDPPVPDTTMPLTPLTITKSKEERDTVIDIQIEISDDITSNKGFIPQIINPNVTINNTDDTLKHKGLLSDPNDTIHVPIVKDTTTEPNLKKEKQDQVSYHQGHDYSSSIQLEETAVDAAETTSTTLTEEQENNMENQATQKFNSVDTTKTAPIPTIDKVKANIELTNPMQSDQPLIDSKALASSSIIKDNTKENKTDDSEYKNSFTIEPFQAIGISTNIVHHENIANKIKSEEIDNKNTAKYIPPKNTVQKTMTDNLQPNNKLPTAEALQQNLNVTITTETTAQTTQTTYITTSKQNTTNVTVGPTKSQKNCVFRISINIFLILSILCHFV